MTPIFRRPHAFEEVVAANRRRIQHAAERPERRGLLAPLAAPDRLIVNLEFDARGNDYLVEVCGVLPTARWLAICVPDDDSSLRSVAATGLDGEIGGVSGVARRLRTAMASRAGEAVATVAWMGYERARDASSVARHALAATGGERLTAWAERLGSHVVPTTIVAHGFGCEVVAQAALRGLVARSVVLLDPPFAPDAWPGVHDLTSPAATTFEQHLALGSSALESAARVATAAGGPGEAPRVGRPLRRTPRPTR